MDPTSPRLRRSRAVAAVVAGAALAGVAAAPASAAEPTACSADALSLSLLGGQPITPIAANAGANDCKNADGRLIGLNAVIANVNAVEATTRVDKSKTATANARVAGLRVGAGPAVDALTGPLTSGANSILGNNGPLASVLNPLLGSSSPLGSLLGPLGGLSLDLGALTGQVTSALPGALSAALPDLVSAGVIQSTATATCSADGGKLAGASQVADLRVLGLGVDANAAANQALNLDTANLNVGRILSVNDLLRGIVIDGSSTPLGAVVTLLTGSNRINAYDLLHAQGGIVGQLNSVIGLLTLGQVSSIGALLDQVTAQLQPVLNQLNIPIPPGLLQAKIASNVQTTQNGTLTQSALNVSVSALGQPILNTSLANARVSTNSADCGGAGGVQDTQRFTSPEAEAILQCSKNPLTLIDVVPSGAKALVTGVAQRSLVGKTATIYLRGKKYGTTKIRSNGTFSVRVAKPPVGIRYTNAARYYAKAGKSKTRALKYSRRMVVTRIAAAKGRVTFSGRVVGPRFKDRPTILIRRRETCKRYKTVARVKPSANGTFSVRMKAPSGENAAVYRAQTVVPSVAGSTKRRPTFTLPRVVGLK
ncbi:hypothetical protein [Patulibacter sp. SYSU D01012]|uniref:hypothetical protein n=1 Tax=Patulibacter sp. SYSU D01012 TaxID=2817381 RepID=UPI001B3135D5|nr:hypothetical protein [Patulibacter sp. SYSU D01012]